MKHTFHIFTLKNKNKTQTEMYQEAVVILAAQKWELQAVRLHYFYWPTLG